MLSTLIKNLRQSAFVSQEDFAKELNVSVSTINRWETGRVCPNISAMKKIKEFCKRNNASFYEIEIEWRKTMDNNKDIK